MMHSRLQIIPAKLPSHMTTVRLLIRHPMETGFRFDVNGSAVSKNVIHTLTAHFEGKQVFKATLGSGISADPFLEFQVRTPQSGELLLQWQDDAGETGEAKARISLTN
ncbi:MAG: thiosulfate oxidation carrier complex protein SoxZ [Betaproteobacteria bacterium]|nr:thiosulfate oxidation carrier complex protein SoxZ [Betaproteobacteria bacterium]